MSNKSKIIQVQNIPISVNTEEDKEYICLTDMAKAKDGESRTADIIKNWIRTRTTLEFIGTREEMQAGLPSFVLSPGQWIEKTNAIGMYVSAGRYGGTYAHKDIAFEFGSAISPVFKLYLIKEFQRLKEDERDRLKLNWNLQRTLEQLVVLTNLESLNAVLISQGLNATDRLLQLNKIAIQQ